MDNHPIANSPCCSGVAIPTTYKSGKKHHSVINTRFKLKELDPLAKAQDAKRKKRQAKEKASCGLTSPTKSL